MARLEQPRIISKVPMRILLSVAALPAAALVAIRALGGASAFLYVWVEYALVALGLTLLLSMVVLGINHRMRDKNTRKYVTIALATLVAILAYIMGVFCWVVAQIGEMPDGIYASPGGTRRVVVMHSSMYDDAGTLHYTAYPMTGDYFYRPTFDETARIAAGGARYEVEWIGEDVARVYLPEPGEALEPHSIEVTFEAGDLPES